MRFRSNRLVGPLLFAVFGCGNQTAIVGARGDRALAHNGGQPNEAGVADAGSQNVNPSDGVNPNQSVNPDAGVNPSDVSSSDDNNLPRFACTSVVSQQFDSVSMKPYDVSPTVAAAVEQTLQAMTPAQQASQMLGVVTGRDYQDIQRSPDVEVAGIGTVRGYRYRDAGRGVNLSPGQDNRLSDGKDYSTVFPTPALRAASWDLDLERRIGAAIGDETAASKNNVLIAPCMNVVRHPYWGRTQETYGEDSYHIGRMATAFAVGIQENVVACAKHFAANNIEKRRSTQNAVLTEQTLREVYGRHFEMVVQDGGVGCVMAAYNLVNGVKSTQNRHLLRDVLKAPVADGGMGFNGFVLTDWWAMPGDQAEPDAATAQQVANEALLAGTDVEVPWQLHYSEATLANADQTKVQEAARRVLTQKYRFGTASTADAWGKKPPTSTLSEGSIATNVEHEDLAEEAVIKSAVLLSNGLGDSGPVLPIVEASTIAVVGVDQDFQLVSSSVPMSCTAGAASPVTRSCTFDFATDPALGDRASSRVNGDPARTVGPFAGIQAVAGSDRTVVAGNAADVALDADVVVVVVGYTPADESEEYPTATGGDRTSLNLPPGHNELVQSVLDLGKSTVIVVQSGSIVNLPWLTHENRKQATVWGGYPGVRGGVALGKLLFGEANFAGKMPMAWPAESELPVFQDSDSETNMGYFFGYREYDKRKYVDGASVELVFPFGHGLSYSSFSYSNLTLPCQTASRDAVFNVTIDITNTSLVDGEETAMLFVKPPPKPVGVEGERPWKELKSFVRVAVPAGETVSAELPLRIRDLRRWEGDANGGWVTDSGDYTILVGKNADDAETATNVGTITVDGS